VEELDQQDIKTALAPIWRTNADTARKAMNRLAIVLRHPPEMAARRGHPGHREGEGMAGQVAA